MKKVETYFYKSQELQPFLCPLYINGMYFTWTHGHKKLDSFRNEFNNFHCILSFTYEIWTESFLLRFNIKNGAIVAEHDVKLIDDYLYYKFSHHSILKIQHQKGKHWG